MARKPLKSPKSLTLWLSQDDINLLDQIAPYLSNDPMIVVTRTDVIRSGIRLMARKWLHEPVEAPFDEGLEPEPEGSYETPHSESNPSD